MLRALLLSIIGILLITFTGLTGLNLSEAAEKKGATPAPAAASTAPSTTDGAEKVNVESIKEKYWARGDESEMGVVQNRLYTKAKKFDIGLMSGILMSDPFLSVKALGGTVGYHFNEYFSAHLLFSKAYSGNSAALDTLIGTGQTTNYNTPTSYFGVEGNASFLYGKLSLMSQKIIYYDMHLSAGLGSTSLTSAPAPAASTTVAPGATVSQNLFTQHIGIGQRFYLSKSTSFRFDYRLYHFTETIYETTIPTKALNDAGTRANWTNAITIGVDFLIGGPKQ